jgi:hypothetical protein
MAKNFLILLTICFSLSAGAFDAAAQTYGQTSSEPDATVMILDGLIARPLGLAVTTVGTATFLVTLPFSAASGDTGKAARGMIAEPGAWTFTRPMGKSDNKRAEGFFFKD